MTTQRQGPPMHEVKRWGSGVSATAIDMCSNGDGTMYIACMVNNGTDAWIELTRHSGDLSTELDNMKLDPAPEPPVGQNKEDAPCVCVVKYPDGRTAVRVVGLSHFTAESTGRPFIMSAVDVLDMGAVFDALNPKHFEAEAIAGGGGGSTSGPSLAEIEAMVRSVMGNPGTLPFTQLFGDHRSPRTMVSEKVRDASLLLLDPANSDPTAAAYRYLLRYRMIEDGAYSADINAMRARGVGHDGPEGATQATDPDLKLPVWVEKALKEARARLTTDVDNGATG